MNTSMDTITTLFDLYMPDYIRTIHYVPWLFSLLGSALIGLSGILPLLIIPNIEPGKENEVKNREYCLKFNKIHFRQCTSYDVISSTLIISSS